MKKINCIFLIVLLALSLFFPIHSEAEELPLLMGGYTEDGIYYEVFGETLSQQSTLSRYAMRYVIYQGKVTPQPQLPWEETINGIKYSRTLSLLSFRYKVAENKTTATYEGTLYAK